MKRLTTALFSLIALVVSPKGFAEGVQDAAGYSKNSTFQWNVAMDTLSLVTFSGSERVLDVGCGDGKITAYIASKLTKGEVLGVDISNKMIDFATSHYPQTLYPNLQFERQDGAEICFENQFDYVVSFSALHWILDQAKVLKAIHRALVPGGVAALQTYGHFGMGVANVADRLVRTPKWAPYFPSYKSQRVFFTKEEYCKLLKEAGFEQIHVDESIGETLFASRQAFTDFVRPILNFILHLPPSVQAEFIEAVVDENYAMAKAANDGPLLFRDAKLWATATKPKG